MNRNCCLSLTLLGCMLIAGTAFAADVQVTGGQTSVVLDPEVLGAVGLSIARVSDDVIVPGSLPDSVAFAINPRDAMAPALPTTFAYDSDDFLNTFSGTIEHTGSVFFLDADMDETETGNFTIGFDAGRIAGDASGFFVQSNVGLVGTLFDVATPSVLDARPDGLTVQAPLLISPELATVLGDVGLAGSVVGEAKVEAVPEPAALGMTLIGSFALLWARRRA